MLKIPLGPKYKNIVAIIDAEDLEKISFCNWHVKECKKTTYVRAGIKNKTILLHRIIMDCPKGMVVDHINGNGLDNRKSNLRICKQSQNVMNNKKRPGLLSKYKGVTWDKSKNKWKCAFWLNSKTIFQRRYDKEIEAALAYDNLAKIHYGEFAQLNFPRGARP